MSLTPSESPFSDARTVARYAEGPPRIVPGFTDMQRMTALLLAERVPEKGRVLVVGAGGGLELQTFAQAHSSWTFDGVDPSSEMIRLAEQTLGPLASRVRLYQGEVDIAPEGPFDAATCLLTMHFIELEERRRVAVEIRRRLRPGSPFVVVHLSIPHYEDAGERSRWLSRYAAFAVSSGIAPQNADTARAMIESRLKILTPEHDEAVLREAGFSNVSLFYAGFSFRGWVAYA
ncbi:class I SAM-dependent methyltransferase [Gimesia sp.]|uniref:class I SAM-dependent methyltransferase n=1 Tax=Gimesia sp. TaxID=2024833 RepID=UPI003A8D1034